MELVSTRICMAKDLGVHGNLFGGYMLALLDESGAALASTITGTPNLVTLKMEEVVFKRPVKTGHLLKIYGEVSSIGTSSITLSLEARSYSVENQSEKVVCLTKITFVRITTEGESCPISGHVRDKYKHLSRVSKIMDENLRAKEVEIKY